MSDSFILRAFTYFFLSNVHQSISFHCQVCCRSVPFVPVLTSHCFSVCFSCRIYNSTSVPTREKNRTNVCTRGAARLSPSCLICSLTHAHTWRTNRFVATPVTSATLTSRWHAVVVVVVVVLCRRLRQKCYVLFIWWWLFKAFRSPTCRRRRRQSSPSLAVPPPSSLLSLSYIGFLSQTTLPFFVQTFYLIFFDLL